jgi:hypothetical protein
MSISSPFPRFFNTLSDRLAIPDPAFKKIAFDGDEGD